MSLSILGAIGVLVSGVSLLYTPITSRREVLGYTRPLDKIHNIHGEELKIIPDTTQCEDLHLYKPSNTLFTACQVGSPEYRHKWFPPLTVFDDPKAAREGSIYTVNPNTFTSQKLNLRGFTGPFVTHGIDLWQSESEPNVVYIYAVNHLPNPDYGSQGSPYKTRSQIELFKHALGTTEAEHLRSIRHPLIQTPNDILATGPDSFYVTNDHYYREGLGRILEQILPESLVRWTNLIFVQLDSTKKVDDATSHVQASIALDKIRNNNGLGNLDRERASRGEFIVVDAAGGVTWRVKQPASDKLNNKVEIVERIPLTTTLDNPFYYEDPYPEVGGDASGYILSGLARGFALGESSRDPDGTEPVVCWHVRGNGQNPDKHSAWERRLIFQDDSTTIRSASGTAMIPIDPKDNGGKKQAWLFITGFQSRNMVATKINL